jgi:hypothetical protein
LHSLTLSRLKPLVDAAAEIGAVPTPTEFAKQERVVAPPPASAFDRVRLGASLAEAVEKGLVLSSKHVTRFDAEPFVAVAREHTSPFSRAVPRVLASLSGFQPRTQVDVFLREGASRRDVLRSGVFAHLLLRRLDSTAGIRATMELHQYFDNSVAASLVELQDFSPFFWGCLEAAGWNGRSPMDDSHLNLIVGPWRIQGRASVCVPGN